ncbi:MAG: hypothetical protein OEV64_11140 [Desulfobulbaceae bacterium]|nr:hypothetical protein [Desulfobulbaceae bacterium]
MSKDIKGWSSKPALADTRECDEQGGRDKKIGPGKGSSPLHGNSESQKEKSRCLMPHSSASMRGMEEEKKGKDYFLIPEERKPYYLRNIKVNGDHRVNRIGSENHSWNHYTLKDIKRKGNKLINRHSFCLENLLLIQDCMILENVWRGKRQGGRKR